MNRMAAAVQHPFRWLRRYREVGQVAAITFGIALCVKTFVVDAVHIPSRSMEEALHAGDFVLVNKLLYGPVTPEFLPLLNVRLPHFRLPALMAPRPGDVVVFRFPASGDPLVREGQLLVKRIIALPGQRVEIRSGAVVVDGRVIAPHRGNGADAGSRSDYGPCVVPPKSYFVLGDNMGDSYDSRAWGFVPADRLVGKAFLVYWSIGDQGIRWSRIGSIVH
jgi:signal peptidase I